MPTTPHDDELASAYLDGEVSADERARVEADPALLARVDQLARVRAMVAALEAPPAAGDREAAIAAALAAAEPSDELTAVRARRRQAARWMRPAAIAAAIAVALAIAIPALSTIGDDDTADTASKSLVDDEAASTTAAPFAAADSSAESQTLGAAPPNDLVVLGDYPDADALAADIRSSSTERADGSGAGGGTAGGAPPTAEAACTDAVGSPPDRIVSVERRGRAAIDGQGVVFAVYLLEGGDRYLVVADATCAVILAEVI